MQTKRLLNNVKPRPALAHTGWLGVFKQGTKTEELWKRKS
jgi:hypothetical protein